MRQFLGALALSAMITGAAHAQAPDPKIPHADYANPALWLCRPDLKDNRCKVDLDATVVPANGRLSLETYKPAEAPKIDCFFVYPTVSLDPGYQSDFVPDRMEWNDITEQFARFGKVCRQFAPMYRQGTTTALRVAAGGPAPIGERPPPGLGGFNDILDAWDWYMAHENQGRGVVIIGHSQGAAMDIRLISERIEGKPIQKQLISALLMGAPVMVPPGKDVGGTFKSIPLCRAEDQLGCVITYDSFRDTLPPPANSKFGRGRDGMVVACTNPANLKGGPGKPVSYFKTKGFLNDAGGDAQGDWTRPAQPIATPFVTTPGLLTTQCASNDGFTYLSMHVNAVPADPRTDEVGGEIIRAAGVDPSWGLHMIDVDHSMGDLLRIVGKQGAAYGKKASGG